MRRVTYTKCNLWQKSIFGKCNFRWRIIQTMHCNGHMECKVTVSRNYVKCKAVLCYKTLKENQTHGYIYEICDWDENLIFARTFLFKISWFLIRGCPTHASSFFYILLFSDLKASLIFCGCLFQLPPWIIWDDVGLCRVGQSRRLGANCHPGR